MSTSESLNVKFPNFNKVETKSIYNFGPRQTNDSAYF